MTTQTTIYVDKEVKSIRTRLEETIAREKVYKKYHLLFRDALAKWEGKKINKRLLTDLQKAMPSAVFIWDEIASMLYIKVYGTVEYPTYKEHHSVFIGYTSRWDDRIEETTQCFRISKYDEINPSVWSASIERVANIEKLLVSDYPERHEEAIDAYAEDTKKFLSVVGEYPRYEDKEYMKELSFGKLKFNGRSVL